MSAQTDAMRATAAKIEAAVMQPWTAAIVPIGVDAAAQLRNAASNQDVLVAKLASLGVMVALT